MAEFDLRKIISDSERFCLRLKTDSFPPCQFSPDLPPVYAYPPLTTGYKAGPAPPEARLAEQATPEVELDPEPVQPDAKSPHHPCHIQTLPDEGGGGESSRSEQEEDGLDCELVAVGGREAETEEARPRAKRSSTSEPDCRVPGLPPGPSSAPVPDSDGTAATGEAQKVELLLGCSGQDGPEELGRAKERDREGGAEEEEKTASSECNASVPVEAGLQDEEEEEEEEENVEVVDDDDDGGGEEGSPCSKQDTEVLLSHSSCPPASPCVSLSSDPGLSASSPDTPTQREVAYIWSLELLVASALCTSREALYLPAPPAWTPDPPPQHGLEILAEISELGTMQRNQGSKEEVADTTAAGEYLSSSVYWSNVCTETGRLPAYNKDWCQLPPCLALSVQAWNWEGLVPLMVPGCSTAAVHRSIRGGWVRWGRHPSLCDNQWDGWLSVGGKVIMKSLL